MRIRTIKPEFWRSNDIAALSVPARLLYIGLWSYVDDNGVGRDEARLIQADLFALDEFTEASLMVHRGLSELSNVGLITRFWGPDGRRYLQINAWEHHQKINRPSAPRYARYSAEDCGLIDDSVNTHGVLTEGSVLEQGTGNREQVSGIRGVQGGNTTADPDDLDTTNSTASRKRSAKNAKSTGTRLPEDWTPSPEVCKWTETQFPDLNILRTLDQFRDYWISVAGAKGRKADWDATWRNWVRRAHEETRNKSPYRNQAQILVDMRHQAAQATIRRQQGSALRLIEGSSQ